MTQPGHVIWSLARVANSCVLDRLEGVDNQFEFRKGIPRVAGFPQNAHFTQNMDFPHNTLLIDNLNNTDFLIVASGRLKKFLEDRKLVNVEYLPVTIMDHKNRIASSDYFIIHPIHTVDCLDIDQCGVRWGRIAKDSIKRLDRFIIDDSKIDPNLEIFRIKYYYAVTLVKRELAQAIDAENFTGIRWIETTDYPEN